MKDEFRVFRSRSDVYRAMQLFFITSSTLIAVSYAFPGLLYVPWLFPLISVWAFVLMIISFYYGQTEEEQEEEYATQTQAEHDKDQTPLWEQLPLRSVIPEKRLRDDDEIV